MPDTLTHIFLLGKYVPRGILSDHLAAQTGMAAG